MGLFYWSISLHAGQFFSHVLTGVLQPAFGIRFWFLECVPFEFVPSWGFGLLLLMGPVLAEAAYLLCLVHLPLLDFTSKYLSCDLLHACGACPTSAGCQRDFGFSACFLPCFSSASLTWGSPSSTARFLALLRGVLPFVAGYCNHGAYRDKK